MTSAAQLETTSSATPSNRAGSVSIGTVACFLVGRRGAILAIARCRAALWLGLVLVFAAALAREYDGEDLLHEPWYLLIPLGASLGTSFVLYCLIRLFSSGGMSVPTPFWAGYRQFLTLYWMTAPLALLYAIPFERFASAPDAARANLYLLALVAVWRVALMTRIVSVLYGRSIWKSFAIVMLFADTIALLAIAMMPRPIIDVMGGIHHSESEQVILSITCFIQFWGVVTWPIWLISALVFAMIDSQTKGPTWYPLPLHRTSNLRVSRHLWFIGCCSILVWIFVLPTTQIEQQNRWLVTHRMTHGQIESALQFMSARKPSDFPPYWDPPPRLGYGEHEPPYHEVIDALNRMEVAPWVRKIYLDKLVLQAKKKVTGFHGLPVFQLADMNDGQLQRYRDMLRRSSHGSMIAASHSHELSYLLEPREFRPEPPLAESRREILADIHQLATGYPKDRLPAAP